MSKSKLNKTKTVTLTEDSKSRIEKASQKLQDIELFVAKKTRVKETLKNLDSLPL